MGISGWRGLGELEFGQGLLEDGFGNVVHVGGGLEETGGGQQFQQRANGLPTISPGGIPGHQFPFRSPDETQQAGWPRALPPGANRPVLADDQLLGIGNSAFTGTGDEIRYCPA